MIFRTLAAWLDRFYRYFFVSNRVPVCLQNRERRLVSRFRKRCHLWEGDLHKQFAYNIGTATTDDPRANQLVRFGPRTLLFLSFSLSLSLSFSCCRWWNGARNAAPAMKKSLDNSSGNKLLRARISRQIRSKFDWDVEGRVWSQTGRMQLSEIRGDEEKGWLRRENPNET